MRIAFRGGRFGFTLIEMMIALVITMMMVFAMVEAFRWIGEATTNGRALIEMAGQLRAARYRLELDLNGATVPLRPWTDSNAFPGYFELLEGTASDSNPTQFVSSSAGNYVAFNFADPLDNLSVASKSLFGDLDDVLMFTARNDSEPFRGRFQGNIIESNLAEIIWWAELNDTKPDVPDGQWNPGETFTIRRRVLLIRPDLNNTLGVLDSTLQTFAAKAQFLQNNDVSIRLVDSTDLTKGVAANSLGDLSLRHNRTAHDSLLNATTGLNANGFVSPLQLGFVPSFPSGSPHEGEDVILTNVTAFDFRVWDPNVPIVDDGSVKEALTPGDPGYNSQYSAATAANPPNFFGQGAYVDLGALATEPIPAVNPTNLQVLTNGNYSSLFTGRMADKALLGPISTVFPWPSNTPFVYDPWPIAYERDGFDQNNLRGADEGLNGLDEDLIAGPDDAGERETSPPYPFPLKSIRVSIRMYEADTRQVRQTTHEMNLSQ